MLPEALLRFKSGQTWRSNRQQNICVYTTSNWTRLCSLSDHFPPNRLCLLNRVCSWFLRPWWTQPKRDWTRPLWPNQSWWSLNNAISCRYLCNTTHRHLWHNIITVTSIQYNVVDVKVLNLNSGLILHVAHFYWVFLVEWKPVKLSLIMMRLLCLSKKIQKQVQQWKQTYCLKNTTSFHYTLCMH